MRPRISHTLTILTCFVLATAVQASWVSLDGRQPAEPRLSVEGPQESLRIDIEVPGYDLSSIKIDGTTYSTVGMPGAVPRLERGLPELPVLVRSLMIPGTGQPGLKIVATQWEELAVDPVAPSKGHFTRDMNPDDIDWEFGDFYRTGGVWPRTNFELTDPFIVRDVRGVSLRVHPFQYDADRGVLRILRSATVEIVSDGVGINEKALTYGAIDGQFDRIYRGLFLNYGTDKYTPIDEPGRMLIVCDDAYMSSAQPFYLWKLQKGIAAEIITTSSVGGSAAGIQTAIDTRYAEPEGLTYVVLVGDIAQVPTHSGTVEGADSDPTYGMVDGSDLYPDLFVSRISGNTPTEIQIQVNKFIRYERDPDVGPAADWYHMATGLASNEGSPSDIERANWLRDDLLAYNFTHVDQIYQPTGTSAMITAALNEGRSLVNYIGHGSGTSWSNPPFNISNINSLGNGWMQPWILDVSCSNGDFSNTTCFAEAWLRAGTVAEPKGAVATYSASTLAAWVPPCVMQAHAVDLLCAETENTLGALYFFGGMQVLDDYPGAYGEGATLIEQYNIFGDCSLVVRTDVPSAIAAVHMPVVHLNTPTFAVDVAGEAGLTVSLTDGEVIHGTAVTDGTGHAEIVLTVPVTDPGSVVLTVTGYNMVPYIQTLDAISPSTVLIDPPAVDAADSTDVTVTVYGADGVTPLAGIDVWAQQYGFGSDTAVTDVNGQAVLEVFAPFGPTMDIVGQEPGETYELFREALTVNALALTSPDLTVTTDFGMVDGFGLNLHGTLHATVAETPHSLSALMPGGGIISTADYDLTVVPTSLGQVVGVIGVLGYDVYEEAFDIVEAYGTLSGNVSSGGTPLAGVVVRGLNDSYEEVFSATTNGLGDYAVTEDQLVATYTLMVDEFGYLHHEESYFLGYGANVHDIVLDPAPAGTLSGVVTELGTGAPLAATVRVLRSDDGSLYAETATNPGDGSYSAVLPYFTYDVQVLSAGHIPAMVAVTIDAPTVVRDFALDLTSGNILIIDDGGAARAVPDKFVGKDQTLAAPGYEALPDRSASTMETDLSVLGYTVTSETLAGTDPASWGTYDMIIVSSGANTNTLSLASFRTALSSYCTGGGKLLIEGGEIGWNYRYDTDMMSNVLHMSAWNGDSSGSVTVRDPAHAVMSIPNTVTGPIAVSYSGYGDQDRLTCASDSEFPGSWSSYNTYASIIAYDPDADPTTGQIVFFAFNYDSMATPARSGLLHNAVSWLLAVEAGTGSISGVITESAIGIPDRVIEGATVELLPTGQSMVTGPDGTYTFTELNSGEYTVRASKDGWSTEESPVSLGEGQVATGVELTLFQIAVNSYCVATTMIIPDEDPTGIEVVIPVPGSLGNAASAVEVYLDVSHDWVADLTIELRSPDGTTVVLHQNEDMGVDLQGWYPADYAPTGDLADFDGGQIAGDWTLHIRDTVAMSKGNFNEVCLRITHEVHTTGAGDGEAPRAFTLGRNVPNPFNPSTTIHFSLPSQSGVRLDIYDVAGRKVRTLVDGVLPGAAHAVQWHGRDDDGRQVGSGVYYYRVVTDHGTDTKKMTLLK